MILLHASKFLEIVSIDNRKRDHEVDVSIMRFINLAHPIRNNSVEGLVRSWKSAGSDSHGFR
jgi:hypothetical protein